MGIGGGGGRQLSAKEIAEQLTRLGSIFNITIGFKGRALQAIIDAQEQARKERNPRMTGEIPGYFHPLNIGVFKKNPMEYLKEVRRLVEALLALEQLFIEKFVSHNTTISEKAKKLIISGITTHQGSWHDREEPWLTQKEAWGLDMPLCEILEHDKGVDIRMVTRSGNTICDHFYFSENEVTTSS
ncbi:hypothetical protein HZA99_02410 [Candidatus Woesearchaeota archaeon]|nr:hypothetical protein [Candidatus Woesearchaeota archaeon]